MAKLPGIVQQPLGQWHARNLPKLDTTGETRAFAELMSTFAGALDDETASSAALAGAANDLTELRAKLETSRQVDIGDVPEDILFPIEMATFDENGDGRDEVRPFAFTHEVADEWWALKSDEIVQTYAGQISDPAARAEFIEDATTRWVVPGTLAIGKASITKRVAHNRGQAEVAIDAVLATNMSSEEKEEMAIGIIDKHTATGGDPIWAASKKAALGPAIDQVDYQNLFRAAETQEEVEDIRNEMWDGDNRMSPEQLRTMDAQAGQLLIEMEKKEAKFQTENADTLWVGIDRGQVTIPDVTIALERDEITSSQHNQMITALTDGSTTDFSSPGHLSAFRNRIIQIPYTGNTTTVREQGRILKNRIVSASRGLTPVGTADGLPATISGTDAAKLLDEVDREVEQALSSPDYDRAWLEIKTTLNVSGGIDGMIQGQLYGSQPEIDAAMAFKRALDSYMNNYGIDARPSDFVTANLATYTSANFEDPLNREFVVLYAPSRNYMTEEDGKLSWTPADQERFRRDTAALYRGGTIDAARMNEISARYAAYFMGQGTPPPDQANALETPDYLYQRRQ